MYTSTTCSSKAYLLCNRFYNIYIYIYRVICNCTTYRSKADLLHNRSFDIYI